MPDTLRRRDVRAARRSITVAARVVAALRRAGRRAVVSRPPHGARRARRHVLTGSP